MSTVSIFQQCLLLVFTWQVHTAGIERETVSLLREFSPLEIIPEKLYQLPLAGTDREERVYRQSTSLLKPRESDSTKSMLFKPKPASPLRYTGEKLCDGACISVRNCDYHHGHIQGYCSNGNACCVFHKSCGGVSREKVSFFRSPHYPVFNNQSVECSYRVYPSETTCALRVDFQQFSLKKPKKYVLVEKCTDDTMFIMNSARGGAEGICEMENHTALVEVKPRSSLPVIFLFVMQSNNYIWNLKISQINCKKITPWKNKKNCGRQLMYEPNEYDNDIQDYRDRNLSTDDTASFQPTPLIVNGKNAEAREFPWQISLQSTDKLKSKHRCGGSILNEMYILTAAHCVFRNAFISKSKLKVVVGDYILNTTDDGQHEEFEIEKLIVNFNYKPSDSHVNDIAVIKLNREIKFSDKVQPICLPDEDFNVYEKPAIATGWGRLNGPDTTTASAATHLQKLDVNILSQKKCKEMVKLEFEEIYKRNLSYETVAKAIGMGVIDLQICALAKSKKSAACFGDSGGPLVIQNEDDGRYIQAGIVSYGLGKCRTDRPVPGSYTNVLKYLKFISIATSEDDAT